MRTISGVRRLYLDDYYRLVEILTRGSDRRLEITLDEYRFNDPDEIKQINAPVVHDLDFFYSHDFSYSYDARLPARLSELHLSNEGSKVIVYFVSAPDPDYGRTLEVLAFFREGQAWWARPETFFPEVPLVAWTPLPLVAFGALAALFGNRLGLDRLPKLQKPSIMAVYIGALIALFLVLMALALYKDRPILMLKKRSEKTGFFQRHKDSLEKLVIAVMAAAVGAWVKSLFDKP